MITILMYDMPRLLNKRLSYDYCLGKYIKLLFARWKDAFLIINIVYGYVFTYRCKCFIDISAVCDAKSFRDPRDNIRIRLLFVAILTLKIN